MSRLTLTLSLITLLILGGCKDNNDTVESVPPLETSEEVGGTSTLANVPASVSSETPPTASGGAENGVGGTVDSTPVPAEDFQTSSLTEVANRPGQPAVLTENGIVPVGDTTVIPGERFGMVTPTTNYDQLAAEFGSDRLSNTEVHLGEGFMAPATRVDLGNDYSFSVVWTDGDRSAPLEIQDLGSGWAVDGVYKGMPFDELQTVLGEFDLLGFGWDYGGTVMLEKTALEPYNGKMFIRLQPSSAVIDVAGEEFLAVMGDKIVVSSDPNLSGMDITIEQLVIRLTPAY